MKKQHLQFYTALLCSVLLMTMLVFAAEDRHQITHIPLSIDYSFETGTNNGDFNVTTTSNVFYVDDVEITNETDDWHSGDRPKIKVYLNADKDYYFSTTKSNAFTLSGDEASFSAATIKDSKSTMVVTLKLEKLASEDLTVTGLSWNNDSGSGSWTEHKDAKSYQVKLYRGNTSAMSTKIVSDNEYDFSSYLTRSGTYHFLVRVVDFNSDKGNWEESEDWYVSSAMAKDFDSSSTTSSSSGGPGGPGTSSSSGGPGSNMVNQNTSHWCLDNTGWWYQNSNGSYPANQWMLINQKWYFFDHTGYMKTGWILWKNIWYYCDNSGAMLVNATTPDGYWVDGNGVWTP